MLTTVSLSPYMPYGLIWTLHANGYKILLDHVSGNGIYCKTKQRPHSYLDPKNRRPWELVEVES